MHSTSLTRKSMALIVDIMHGWGPSNKMCTHLQPRKAVLVINITAKELYMLLLARRNTLVLKVGLSYSWQSILKKTGL